MQNKVAWLVSVLIPAVVGFVLLTVAWQSSGIIDVIDQSLTRHVEQRLIDRATHAIVMSTTNMQNLWLWLGGLTLNLMALLSAWLLFRRV